MAINVYRSPRAIDFSMRSTSDKVGPGTYSNTHNEVVRTAEERGVPFQSLQEKELNANKSTSAITPGPGAYIDGGESIESVGAGGVVGGKQTSVFKSTSNRMCPTAPGSSIFLPSTIVENPGPGSYPIPKSWSKNKKAAKGHQPPVLELAHTVPSIPPQKVHPGQLSDKKKESEMAGVQMRHTGEKADTVGPAEYEVTQKVTQKDALTVNFHSSNMNRRLFEPSSFIENRLPSRQNPGPGTYDSGSEKQQLDPLHPSSLQHHMFASKTPMAHERVVKPELSVPGPGAYRSEDESKIIRADVQGQKSQFGSTVDRKGWSRPMNQPFTDPYNLKVPGPGHYPDPGSSFITPRKPNSDPQEVVQRKKFYGVHHPAQIMALQEMQGPLHAFHSTDIRPCNRKFTQTTPAPGEYNNDDSLGFSISSVLKEKATVGKKGVFGTTAGRFDRSALGPINDLSVDAGMYDVKDSGKGDQDAARSMFQSQTARFKANNEPRGMGGFADTYAVPVGTRQGPGPADYITDKDVNYRSPFRHPRREHLSFGTGRPRFDAKEIFHGQQYNLNPGPGDYNMPRGKKISGSAKTRASRAAGALGCTTVEVGPGSYDTGGTLLKKTYNVSTEQPADLTM